MCCLFHPALKFIYFIRNICDRYSRFVYCVVFCLFSLVLNKNSSLLCEKLWKTRTKKIPKEGLMVCREMLFYALMYRYEMKISFGILMAPQTLTQRGNLFTLKSILCLWNFHETPNQHKWEATRENLFPLERAETSFPFFYPEHFMCSPSCRPITSSFHDSLFYIQLTQIPANLLEHTWIWETPLDAKRGISLQNCFLDMK